LSQLWQKMIIAKLASPDKVPGFMNQPPQSEVAARESMIEMSKHPQEDSTKIENLRSEVCERLKKLSMTALQGNYTTQPPAPKGSSGRR
ncbi:MAG: hypothetical protein ACXWRU_19365, partial [Pseudobdellovibrionaceae bacterium]